jgi:tetratricopeptide (TPR) repeat protein
MSAFAAAFSQALHYHQAGHLREAEQLYQKILQQAPDHADAHHLLGVLAFQTGRHDRAVRLIQQALTLNPGSAPYHSNLGNALLLLGRRDQALAHYRSAIQLQPDFPDPWINVGAVLLDQGKPSEAVAHFRQALRLQPEYPEAYNNLGNACKAQGQLDEAAAHYREALRLRPAFVEAHNNLGLVLLEQGKLSEAVAHFRQALRFQPDFPEAYNGLGNACKARGQTGEAEANYREALRLRPAFLAAHNNLGLVLLDQGKPSEAVAHFRQALCLEPNCPEAHLNLGNACKAQGQLDEAAAQYRQALRLRPDDASILDLLGSALLGQHDLSGAEVYFRKALALAPDSANIWNGLGVVLRSLGRFEEASDCFRRALAICPDRAAFHRNLISIGVQEADPVEVERLRRLLKQPGLALQERAAAGFALGKLLDDAARFDEAFACFARANALLKQTPAAAHDPFDGAQLRRGVDRMIQSFTPSFFAQRRSWGEASERPVFIVGLPRSGTTLVEQIAASHPAVFGAGELTDIGQIAVGLSPREGSATGQGWDAGSIARAAGAHLQRLRSLDGAAARVIDKMPGNVYHLGLIAVLFPAARVIFCRRDARDTCLSCYFQWFAGTAHPYTYDLADCGRYYLETDRLMAHWLRVLPLRMLEIHYEALVADQEGQSRRLLDFLGLPWHPACLEFHRAQRPVLTASDWQVRQPMYRRSVGRWRHYARHLRPLLEVLAGWPSNATASR